jgi:hypothetical protein
MYLQNIIIQISKCVKKILKTGKQVIFGIFQDSFSGLKNFMEIFQNSNLMGNVRSSEKRQKNKR